MLGFVLGIGLYIPITLYAVNALYAVARDISSATRVHTIHVISDAGYPFCGDNRAEVFIVYLFRDRRQQNKVVTFIPSFRDAISHVVCARCDRIL